MRGVPTEAPPLLQASATTSAAAGPAVPGPAGHGHRRSRTLSLKVMAHERRRAAPEPGLQPLLAELDRLRPRCRAQCEDLPRPCLFLSCRHHLFLDVNPETGSIKFNFPGIEPWEMTESCALDVADRGGVTLEEVGSILNVTRERIRQMETRALWHLKERADLPALEQAG